MGELTIARERFEQSLAGIVNLLDSHTTVWQSCGMNTAAASNHYKNHRFPAEIISHAVWLYFRFCLSFRDVEELLLERGVVVTDEAIRKWCRKLANTMPINCAADVRGRVINGTSTRWCSPSKA